MAPDVDTDLRQPLYSPALANDHSWQPKLRRVSYGTIVPVALAFLAAIFAYEALIDRSAMTSVAVARVAIAAGDPVSPADVQTVSVHQSDKPFAKTVISPSELTNHEVAMVDLSPGQLITSAEIAPKRSTLSQEEMSVPVSADDAVGGQLAAGDQVDIIQTGPGSKAQYIAQDLTVVSVASSDNSGGILNSDSGSFYVVLGVTKRTALILAATLGQAAQSQGIGVEVVRSEGKPSSDLRGPLRAATRSAASHVPNS